MAKKSDIINELGGDDFREIGLLQQNHCPQNIFSLIDIILET